MLARQAATGRSYQGSQSAHRLAKGTLVDGSHSRWVDVLLYESKHVSKQPSLSVIGAT